MSLINLGHKTALRKQKFMCTLVMKKLMLTKTISAGSQDCADIVGAKFQQKDPGSTQSR